MVRAGLLLRRPFPRQRGGRGLGLYRRLGLRLGRRLLAGDSWNAERVAVAFWETESAAAVPNTWRMPLSTWAKSVVSRWTCTAES